VARAWFRNGQSQKWYWCDYCEGWYEDSNFTTSTYYRTEHYDSVEYQGTSYFEGTEEYTMTFHDNCDELACAPDDSPKVQQLEGIWVCGACDSEYVDQEVARECCT
jgi:hypothetical protein